MTKDKSQLNRDKLREWEKEFDVIFTDLARGYSHHGVEIKSFIHSLLKQEHQRILEEVEKLKERFRCGACDEKISNLSHTQCCQVLSYLIQTLKEEK